MSPFESYGYGLPKGVKYLLISNAAVFALQVVAPTALPFYLLMLIPEFVTRHFMVWQFFTYMFLHHDIAHIGLNMLALWMFGTELEYNWGTRDFLKFYFVSGIGGGVLQWALSFTGLTSPMSPTLGASGAIFGLLVAYGLMWPDRMILVFGILPMKALQMVILFAAYSLFQGLTGTGGNIAVFVHLGGGITGFVYLKYGWRMQAHLEHWMKRLSQPKFTVHQGGRGGRLSDDPERTKEDEEVDRILDKIAKQGMDSLDSRERRILDRESERKRGR
jgi:membrane associated rhomboid family serine protease